MAADRFFVFQASHQRLLVELNQFGYRGVYGNSITISQRRRHMHVQVQFYANACDPGEYVDAKGYCVQCDPGFFCPDGISSSSATQEHIASARVLQRRAPHAREANFNPGGTDYVRCLPRRRVHLFSKGTKCSKCLRGGTAAVLVCTSISVLVLATQDTTAQRVQRQRRKANADSKFTAPQVLRSYGCKPRHAHDGPNRDDEDWHHRLRTRFPLPKWCANDCPPDTFTSRRNRRIAMRARRSLAAKISSENYAAELPGLVHDVCNNEQ